MSMHQPQPRAPGTSSNRHTPISSRSDTPLHFRDVVLDVMRHYKEDKDSEAHRIFREAAGHKAKAVLPQTVNPDEETVPGILHPDSTGVIYCSDRAMANGFSYAEAHEWANMGQGAHEVGPIPGSAERPTHIDYPLDTLKYAPTTGLKSLRQAAADMYNHTYRQGKASQYSYENVYIVPGGRAGLSRVAAVTGDVYTSHQIPDYTAYNQVLSAFRRLVPVSTALEAEKFYQLDIEQTKKDIRVQGLAVLIASNTRNPTGQVIRDEKLKELVAVSRESTTTLVLDEFYSWYICPEREEDLGKSVSAAEYIEDVNSDSVVIIDGLTKAPSSHPLQLAALPLLKPDHIMREQIALRKHFKEKRDHVLKRLHDTGLDVKVPPVATFYIWLNLEQLPPPLNNGSTFFEELLKEKMIVIPGIFFDINPSHRRNLFSSLCHHFVRLWFGPPMKDLDMGLGAIQRVLRKAKKEGMRTFEHSYKKSEHDIAMMLDHV